MNKLYLILNHLISYKSSSFTLGAIISLFGKGIYIHWGVIQISLANFIIIIAMFVVFGLALILPFPSHKSNSDNKKQ